MVKTGYISFVTETGAGFDGNGNPIAPTKTASLPVPCNIKVITKEHRTLVDGQYLQGKYSCYVDSIKIPVSLSSIFQSIKEVQLKDNHQNSLGTFQIHNVEYLDLSKSVKIIV